MSALIHAATMVTAGVYLLVRMSPVLALSSSGRMTIAVIGGRDRVRRGDHRAPSQKDIKKVLAFSTVSQIGYMVLAVGVGRLLGGDLPHGQPRLLQGAALPRFGLGDPLARRRAGHAKDGRAGASYLPLTFPTFLIGWLTISGVPPFAGFWSKGDVLTNVFAHNKPLWVLGVADRDPHRVLHEPSLRPDLPRHRALPRGHPRPRPARVALGHDRCRSSCWPRSRCSAACSTCPGCTRAPSPRFLAPTFGFVAAERPRRAPVAQYGPGRSSTSPPR